MRQALRTASREAYAMEIFIGLIALALMAYLFAALIRPEWF
jgi:K+-transporting ATPase KdpF subunit